MPGVCVSNECTTSVELRPQILPAVIDGSDYTLDVTQTVATLGTSFWEFIGKYSMIQSS